MVNEIRFDYLYKEFYALWFGILILNFASNREILISLESRIFHYLGKISYGLYMYHPICIALVLNLLLLVKQTPDWLLYPLSLFTVVLLAGISYKYFESYFLRFKEKYSIVASGEKMENNGRSAPQEQVAQRP
jgi:peptidoglycan/LPS O-acetylase OafA/YrhL